MERQVLQERIISALKRSPADKYLLQKQFQSATVAELSKAITNLLEQKLIHVSSYHKSKRSGLDVPVFSAGPQLEQRRPDLHSLLPGVTSERLVEYDFVSRNILSKQRSARILDVGANPEFTKKLKEFSGGNWNVFGIDLLDVDDLSAKMDARQLGFRDETFDQILCTSTIEHVGLAPNEQDDDEFGDIQAMKELLRVLCKGGSLILTVPYGNRTDNTRTRIVRPTMVTRVYGRDSLRKLVEGFSIKRQEFYFYRSGRWQRCSQAGADKFVELSSSHEQVHLPLSFHSAACACLLLTRKNGTLGKNRK